MADREWASKIALEFERTGRVDWYSYGGARLAEDWHEPVRRAVCGTDAGWQRHYRAREYACDGCVRARRAYQRAWARRGRCERGLGWPMEAPR